MRVSDGRVRGGARARRSFAGTNEENAKGTNGSPDREEREGSFRRVATERATGGGPRAAVETRRTVISAGIRAFALVPERIAVLRRAHRALQQRAAVGVASARGHLP